MASTRLKTTKDGKKYYEIRVSMGRGKTELTQRWYVPEGWSQKKINSELNKVSAKFEEQCKAGEVKTRRQAKEERALEAAEQAKIRTLKDYAEKVFMPEIAGRCSEHCRSSFQGILNKHIYPELGFMKLPEITTAQLSALLLKKQTEGLKAASCVKIYTVLNLIFKKAYDEDEMIDRNPMDKVKRPKATKAEGKDGTIKAFTEQEMAYILECADKESLQWRTLIWLAAYTGCRKGELTGLKWDCVDFKEGQILIKRNLCYTPQKGIYLTNTKNGKSRTIDLDPFVMSLLAKLREEHSGNILTIDRNSSGFVFTQEGTDQPMHPDSPTRYFKRFGKKYGIEDFHPHKLRHTLASVMIRNGADVVSVSAILGHSDSAVTLRMYAHASREGQKRAGAIFSSAIAVNK